MMERAARLGQPAQYGQHGNQPISHATHPVDQAPAKDCLYSRPQAVEQFCFDNRVATVFDDMVRRSVPGYAASLELIRSVVPQLCQRHSWQGYDLGCALGAASQALLSALQDKPGRLYAIDNSSAMLAQLRRQLDDPRLYPISGDVRKQAFEQADVILLHFTLQFVPLAEQPALLRKCAAALAPGGGLLLFEKIDSSASLEQAHGCFKQLNGYSQLEIAQKRQALESVLVRQSPQAHVRQLRACGFSTVEQIFQALNFVGWLARA